MKKLAGQIGKFLIVGVSAFLIDYTLMVLLTEFFSVNYLISATISFSVSILFNFFASMRFVFSRKEDLSRKGAFFIFIILSVLGLVLNGLLMWVGVDVFDADYRVIKIIVGSIIGILNFVAKKILIEERNVNIDLI